jgi:hypothetical protein
MIEQDDNGNTPVFLFSDGIPVSERDDGSGEVKILGLIE